MRNNAISRLFASPKIKSDVKAQVLFRVITQESDLNGRLISSNRRLAKLTGYTVKVIRNRIDRLVEWGFIDAEVKYCGSLGSNKCTEFKLKVIALPLCESHRPD